VYGFAFGGKVNIVKFLSKKGLVILAKKFVDNGVCKFFTVFYSHFTSQSQKSFLR